MNVATIIPTHKFTHLRETLLSLSRQTYKNFKVFILDDSENQLVSSDAKGFLKSTGIDLDIEYCVGPQVGDAAQNMIRGADYVRGKYDLYHFLFHDDIIYPTFYSEHVNFHSALDLNITTSSRWYVDSLGRPISASKKPNEILQKNAKRFIIEDAFIAKSMLPSLNNWIGELSNTVISESMLPYACLQKEPAVSNVGLGDVSLFIFSDSKIGYIDEPLGGFRLHPDSHSMNSTSGAHKAAVLAWINVALEALGRGFISERQVATVVEKVATIWNRKYPDNDEFSVVFKADWSAKEFLLSRNLYRLHWAGFRSRNFPYTQG